MITEQYISFETAKLLKEKGFNEPTLAYCYGENMINYFSKPKLVDKYSSAINLPTQSLVMRWLREMHSLYFELTPIFKDRIVYYDYSILQQVYKRPFLNDGDLQVMYCEDFKSYLNYEQACESAIKYYLENLI